MNFLMKYSTAILIAFGLVILFLTKIARKPKSGFSRRKQRKQRKLVNSAMKTINSAFKQITGILQN